MYVRRPWDRDSEPPYGLLGVRDTASRLGYSTQHVAMLIREGALIGRKIGTTYVVEIESIEQYEAGRQR